MFKQRAHEARIGPPIRGATVFKALKPFQRRHAFGVGPANGELKICTRQTPREATMF
jgi:hypothetical protein